ncbi:hypothetical protein KKF34_02960 [Myxococcota bacterium]|nr:hypothetical protein [Myxococcota bacterium]MBU1382604.1 hypothetical protein [Myxococcota bacterium]MBU1495821.1 hypothetical protein [Myxococcota bacterium]
MKITRLLFIMSMLFVAFTGCRDDDDSENNNNTNNINNPNDDTIYAAQNPANPGFIQEGDAVDFKGVVVTAVDKSGSFQGNIWVAEPNGGPYSGVMVYNMDLVAPWFTNIKVGDLVDITGLKVEYNYNNEFEDGVTEIESPTVTIQGTTSVPAPVEIDITDLNTVADAEPYEGVLVTLQNVRVTTKQDRNGRLEVNLYQGTKLQDDLMDLSTVAEGACLSKVTGIVTYFYGYYILPRTAADIEVSADDNACPVVADEICDDEQDNDGNGFTDCEDFACIGDPACPPKAENTNDLCSNSTDDDEDGMIDCADPSCSNHPDVTLCKESSCDDGADNDGDGYTDCEDWDCANDTACAGEFEQNCTDGLDDDGDTYIDCNDNDCKDDPACIETDCADGVDNDGNGFTDCADFACLYNSVDCQEGREVTDATCSDGIDNDGNGFMDCQDNSCRFNPNVTVCEGTAVTCADGLDNDGNGFVDCGDFSCRYCHATDPTKDHVVATCPPCVHE